MTYEMVLKLRGESHRVKSNTVPMTERNIEELSKEWGTKVNKFEWLKIELENGIIVVLNKELLKEAIWYFVPKKTDPIQCLSSTT